MLPILGLAAAALAILSCRNGSPAPSTRSNTDAGNEAPPNWDGVPAPSAESVQRELQRLFNGAYRLDSEPPAFQTLNGERATAFQDRLAWVRNRAFRDPRAAQAYDIPQIRRFFYLNPERSNAAEHAALEAFPVAQRSDLYLSQLGEWALEQPFRNNSISNDLSPVLERTLGEENFREEWASANRIFLQRQVTTPGAWLRPVESANQLDLSRAYFYLLSHYDREAQEFRLGPESQRPSLLRSLAAANPPFPFSDRENLASLVRVIALVASSRRIGFRTLMGEMLEDDTRHHPERSFFGTDLRMARESEDPLDNAVLRYRAIDLARDYLRQGPNLPLAERMDGDRLQFGVQLLAALEDESFGPLEAGLRNSLFPSRAPSTAPLLALQELRRIANNRNSSRDVSISEIPAAWRQAARSIVLPGGQNLETLVDAEVRSFSLVSSDHDLDYGFDYLGRHFLVNAYSNDPWESFLELALGAHRLRTHIPDLSQANANSILLHDRNHLLFEGLVRRQLIDHGQRSVTRQEFASQVLIAVQVRFLNQQLGFLEGNFDIQEHPPLVNNRQPSLDWRREFTRQVGSEAHMWRVVEESHRLGRLYPSLSRRRTVGRQ